MTAATRTRGSRPAGPACTLLAAVALAAFPVPAAAQGCPMCRETAGFQKDRAISALKRGILTLAIPPAGIAAGLAWLVWKRSDRFASG